VAYISYFPSRTFNILLWFLHAQLSIFLETVDQFVVASAWTCGHITAGIYALSLRHHCSRFIYFFKQATWMRRQYKKLMKAGKVNQKEKVNCESTQDLIEFYKLKFVHRE